MVEKLRSESLLERLDRLAASAPATPRISEESILAANFNAAAQSVLSTRFDVEHLASLHDRLTAGLPGTDDVTPRLGPQELRSVMMDVSRMADALVGVESEMEVAGKVGAVLARVTKAEPFPSHNMELAKLMASGVAATVGKAIDWPSVDDDHLSGAIDRTLVGHRAPLRNIIQQALVPITAKVGVDLTERLKAFSERNSVIQRKEGAVTLGEIIKAGKDSPAMG